STPDLDRHTAVGRELTLLDFDAGSEFIQTESAGRQQILESPESIEDFTLVHQHVSTSTMGIQEAAAFLKQLAQKRGPDAIPHQCPALPHILLPSAHLWQLRGGRRPPRRRGRARHPEPRSRAPVLPLCGMGGSAWRGP